MINKFSESEKVTPSPLYPVNYLNIIGKIGFRT